MADKKIIPTKSDLREIMSTITVAPKCFDSIEQYREWYEIMIFSSRGERNSPTICRDCTPEYQSRMIMAGRCEEPGTVFILKPSWAFGIRSLDLIGQPPRLMTQGYNRRKYRNDI